jgi:hypothetical protein
MIAEARLGDDVLVLDDTSFPKQGESVGRSDPAGLREPGQGG